MSTNRRAEYLELDGRLAFVEVEGDGRPLLCVHTAGQSGVQYRNVSRGLAELGYQVIIVDLPGHGRSEPAANGPINDLSWYGDWCIRLLARMSVRDPYLLGCSIGGKIVLDMATKVSRDLAGVVAMAAYGQRGGKGRSARPWGLEDSGSPSNRDRSYYGHAALCGRSVPPDVVEMIALMHCREDWHITVSDQTGWSRQDIWDQLGDITCPTYLVVGEDDFGVPYDRVKATAARIPLARTAIVDGIGHYPMEEMPDFVERFDGWVTTLREMRAAPVGGDPR
jgi:pimeloyl-ACP methyl ester carboxylesterase